MWRPGRAAALVFFDRSQTPLGAELWRASKHGTGMVGAQAQGGDELAALRDQASQLHSQVKRPAALVLAERYVTFARMTLNLAPKSCISSAQSAPRRLQPEQHRHPHQVARAERAVERIGIAKATGRPRRLRSHMRSSSAARSGARAVVGLDDSPALLAKTDQRARNAELRLGARSDIA
jgi:hypothetical protein